MPRGDRTGPNGMGPMTGRQAGYCAGFDTPGFNNNYFGARGGGGFGRGNRFRFRGGFQNNAYSAAPEYPNVSEKTMLENEIKILKEQLNSFEQRLTEIKDK